MILSIDTTLYVVLNVPRKGDHPAEEGCHLKNTKQLLGARIKELRKGRRLSQEELAELIGIEPRHMSRIEVGKSYPSLDRLERIANALNVDLRDFFDFGHLEARPVKMDQISEMLNEMTDDDLKKVTRILKVFIR